MKKRSHKNTTRLTARERRDDVSRQLHDRGFFLSSAAELVVERALQAHARQALARKKARTVVVKQLVQNAPTKILFPSSLEWARKKARAR